MAAIDDVAKRNPALDAIKTVVTDLLWAWIDAHQDMPFTLKVWFFRKTFKIGDLDPVFEILLGPRPMAA